MFQDAVLLACLVEAEIVSTYYGILINSGVGSPTISLARLVEADIVSLYCGILINMGVGNPTALSAWPLGNRRVLMRVERCLIFAAFIKG